MDNFWWFVVQLGEGRLLPGLVADLAAKMERGFGWVWLPRCFRRNVALLPKVTGFRCQQSSSFLIGWQGLQLNRIMGNWQLEWSYWRANHSIAADPNKKELMVFQMHIYVACRQCVECWMVFSSLPVTIKLQQGIKLHVPLVLGRNARKVRLNLFVWSLEKSERNYTPEV